MEYLNDDQKRNIRDNNQRIKERNKPRKEKLKEIKEGFDKLRQEITPPPITEIVGTALKRITGKTPIDIADETISRTIKRTKTRQSVKKNILDFFRR